MDALIAFASAVKYKPVRALLISIALPYNSMPLPTVFTDMPLASASCRLPETEIRLTERLLLSTSCTERSLTKVALPAMT